MAVDSLFPFSSALIFAHRKTGSFASVGRIVAPGTSKLVRPRGSHVEIAKDREGRKNCLSKLTRYLGGKWWTFILVFHCPGIQLRS